MKRNLDPAYFLAKSRIESRHGVDPKNQLNRNIGNLKARKGEKADAKGFAVYKTFEEGARALIDRLVSNVYVGSGKNTVETINSTNTNIEVIHQIKNQLYEMEQRKKKQKTTPQKPFPPPGPGQNYA